MSKRTSKVVNGNSDNGITKEELRANNGAGGVWWSSINGTVYDLSDFYASHPGGDIIRTAAGRLVIIAPNSFLSLHQSIA
jgi:cytochrome b involved in lipid metabolism